MPETYTLIIFIGAFINGYAIAYCVKNIGHYRKRWGLLRSVIFFPPITVFLLLMSAKIADEKNILLSLVFLSAYLFRMVKNDN